MTPLRDRLPSAVADFPAIYARTARFSTGTPRTLTVTAAGSRVLFCRAISSDDRVLCLWTIDVDNGHERLLVDPRALGPDEAELPAAERTRRERARESASGIVAYSVDQSGSVACFALAGALFVVDVGSGAIRSPDLGDTVFDPRLNDAGTAIAYVDGGRLCVIDADTFNPLTERSDPDPLVGYGRAEFIAAEEMQRSRGFWWAPDGSGLLVTRVDENPVPQWWIADPAHPERAPDPVRYPAAGSANAAVSLEHLLLDGTASPIAWDDDGRFEYLADVVWQDGYPPLIVRQTRDQRLVSIAELSLENFTVTERRQITDDIWVELIPGSPTWCGNGVLTIEDLDGVRRLLLDGERLGDPDLNIRSIVGVLADGDQNAAVVVTAWPTPTEIHLHAIPLPADPVQDPVQLTTVPGVHSGVMGGTTLILSVARPDHPGTSVSIQRVDPVVLELTKVAPIVHHATDPGFGASATFTVLGVNQLESAVFLPSWHDGETPLPVVLDPYGGPHAQRVLKAHNPHLVSRWLSEQGYAVLVTDGRGTPGRGPSWERSVWGNLADPVLDDQIEALDALLARHDFLDRSRVGIRGWSFGGYLAALAVLRRPDRFHAAIAGAPVAAWRLYDTHYTERYLGHPEKFPDHYRTSDLFSEGDPIELSRPLLLIHGLADDNVVAAHTLRFSTELLASGCPHQVLPLSGVTHMTPQEAVAENLLRFQLRFLDDSLGTDRR